MFQSYLMAILKRERLLFKLRTTVYIASLLCRSKNASDKSRSLEALRYRITA